MSISRERFEKKDFKQKFNGILENHPVIKFLRIQHRNAWRVDEIEKKIGLNKHTIRGTLRKAVKKGLVIHSEPYFIAKVNSKKSKKSKVTKTKKK